jgi:hypothetical protein
MKSTILALLALIAVVVGFVVLDYCGGAGTGLTFSTFFTDLQAALNGALHGVLVICALAVALILGSITLLPLIIGGCIVLAVLKTVRNPGKPT